MSTDLSHSTESAAEALANLIPSETVECAMSPEDEKLAYDALYAYDPDEPWWQR